MDLAIQRRPLDAQNRRRAALVPAGRLQRILYMPPLDFVQRRQYLQARGTISRLLELGVVPGAVYGWPKNLLHLRGIEHSINDLVATVRPALTIVPTPGSALAACRTGLWAVFSAPKSSTTDCERPCLGHRSQFRRPTPFPRPRPTTR